MVICRLICRGLPVCHHRCSEYTPRELVSDGVGGGARMSKLPAGFHQTDWVEVCDGEMACVTVGSLALVT